MLNTTIPLPADTPPAPAGPTVADPPPPSHDPTLSSAFGSRALYEWVRSATWHYSSAPETRVQPDYCNFFTFYSHPAITSLPVADYAPSSKSSHRLNNITKDDALAFREAITAALNGSETHPCSRLNWRRVAEGVMDRYGARIKELQQLLSTAVEVEEEAEAEAGVDAAGDIAVRARTLAHAALVPFLDHNDANPASAALSRCTGDYTGHLLPSSLSPSEAILKSAVEETLGRICGAMLEIYFSPTHDLRRWGNEIDELVMWLEWTLWRRCERRCAWDEVCAIPLWPVLGGWRLGGEDGEEVVPRCVNISAIERQWGPGRGRRPGYGYGRRPGRGRGHYGGGGGGGGEHRHGEEVEAEVEMEVEMEADMEAKMGVQDEAMLMMARMGRDW